MLTEYIERAMRHAHYELMENGRFFGTILPCKGAWGEGATWRSAAKSFAALWNHG